MLKNIPTNVSAKLIKVLMEMGHGDELVIADANYPKFGQPSVVIDATGHDIPPLLDSILSLIPLDQYEKNPTIYMQVLPDDPYVPTIWDKYEEVAKKHEKDGMRAQFVDKYTFYERAKNAYAVISTSEKELYANLIIKKGVI